MKANGAGPTCLAMVIEGITGRTTLPSEVASWLYHNTTYCNVSSSKHGTWPRAMEIGAAHYALNYKGLLSVTDVANELKQGRLVIAAVGPNLNGLADGNTHWIVMYGYDADSGKTYVYDSYKNKGTGTWDVLTLWDNRVKEDQTVENSKEDFARQTGYVFYSFWK